MNLEHCSFYWIVKIFQDWVISLRKYSLEMTVALYFKWQYTKVHLLHPGKRLLDSDDNDISIKASSHQYSYFIHTILG